ncbi:MAG TPA: biotin/lipoyl-containing protein [Acidobacteriota bacterium]|nr:biotin/lipoyl-containing protein [Acidobacteriota bacterium]
MKLEISSGSDSLGIEVSVSGNKGQIRIGGREVDYDCVPLPGGQYSLIIEGRVYDLSVDSDTDVCFVSGRRGSHRFRISDPRRLNPRQSMEEGHAGLQRICAEMPGRVIRLLIGRGDKVVLDQGLLVLEAMKMQNEIRAPKAGIVKEIGVEDGRAVGTGDFLLSIE